MMKINAITARPVQHSQSLHISFLGDKSLCYSGYGFMAQHHEHEGAPYLLSSTTSEESLGGSVRSTSTRGEPPTLSVQVGGLLATRPGFHSARPYWVKESDFEEPLHACAPRGRGGAGGRRTWEG